VRKKGLEKYKMARFLSAVKAFLWSPYECKIVNKYMIKNQKKNRKNI